MSGNESNKPGKRFEAKFKRTLETFAENAGGEALRLCDGGRWGFEQQPADFISVYEGKTFLWECKAHHAWRGDKFTRWPLDRIQAQAPRLMKWERSSWNVSSFVAVNLYGDDINTQNECYVIPITRIHDLLCDRTDHHLRSLGLEDFERYGFRLKPAKGNVWNIASVYFKLTADSKDEIIDNWSTIPDNSCAHCEYCSMKPDGTEGFCRAEQEFKSYEEVRMTPEKLGCK